MQLALLMKDEMNKVKILAVSTVTLFLAACGGPKEATQSNFTKAIQAYLDTQPGLCAAIPARQMPFTLENNGLIPEPKKRADALADAGLLTKRDTEVKGSFGNKNAPATEYQVSEIGKQFLAPKAANTLARQDAFCSGKFVMVGVDNFTEPSEMMGMKVSRVNYRFKVDGLADWAKSEAMIRNFKNIADKSQGDIQGKAALILTALLHKCRSQLR